MGGGATENFDISKISLDDMINQHATKQGEWVCVIFK